MELRDFSNSYSATHKELISGTKAITELKLWQIIPRYFIGNLTYGIGNGTCKTVKLTLYMKTQK